VTGPGHDGRVLIHRSPWADLDPLTLHDLVTLRADIFVVEQECSYRELDGRDVEPQTEHLWTADDKGPTSYLRVLADPGGVTRIGRVCTRADARGQGLSGRLMTAALTGSDGRAVVLDAVVLDAQAHLVDWYGRFGFVVDGAMYVEDGIPHLPMRRSATPER
jgi:ElaA protein